MLRIYFTLVKFSDQKKLNTKGPRNTQKHIIYHVSISTPLKAQERAEPYTFRKEKGEAKDKMKDNKD